MAKKKKTKKNIKAISEKEFIFNFLSLTIIIIIGLYFGARSFYYYSKQNMSIKSDSATLNGLIVSNNKLVGSGDGLHRDSDGYYFKGKVANNYVSFGNRLFRVLRINNDNTVKLVSNDLVSSFMWGEESSYEFSNLKYWLNNTGEANSGIYYNSLPNPEEFLVKTSYREDILDSGKVKNSKNSYSDYVTTLSISDYILADGKKGYLKNNKIFYLLGLTTDKENLYVDEDGSIKNCDSLEGYGIRAVITLKNDLAVASGDGSVEKPFVVDQGDTINLVDSYVKLGNDVYKVYQESNTGILKMYLNGYASLNGIEIIRNYNTTNSIFNLQDKNNIANYLNTTYLNNLSYASLLEDNYYYTGEVSAETNYKYVNIYNNYAVCKVGLLNIFDYISNNELNDYFHMNTTSTVGGIQYITFNNGLLGEANIAEVKHFVPVISINKTMLNSGKGTMEDPYTLEELNG